MAGGGISPSWRRPIFGRDRAVRVLLGVSTESRDLGWQSRHTEINGRPGIMVFDPDGGLINVMTLDIAEGVVQTVRSVINPETLRHLGPLGDVRALTRERTAAARCEPANLAHGS